MSYKTTDEIRREKIREEKRRQYKKCSWTAAEYKTLFAVHPYTHGNTCKSNDTPTSTRPVMFPAAPLMRTHEQTKPRDACSARAHTVNPQTENP